MPLLRIRFLSLYFASISIKQSFYNFFNLCVLPFQDLDDLREQFHKSFGELHYGSKCYSFSSGRSSLYACLEAAGIGENDEVLMSSFTCLAVPTAVVALGATPKYCDIDRNNMNIDMENINSHISKKTKAIIIQHTLGSVVSMECINKLRKNNLIVIEDCALAIGSTQDNKLVGTFADAAIYSFELSKTVSCGWGGVLLINNRELEQKVKKNYAKVKELSLKKSLRMSLQVSICGILYSPYIYSIGKYIVSLLFKLRLFSPSTPECELEGSIEEDFVCKMPKSLLNLANEQILRFYKIKAAHSGNYLRLRDKLLELNFNVLGISEASIENISPRVAFLVNDREGFVEYFMKHGIEVGFWFDGPLTPLPKNKNFLYDPSKYPNSSSVAKSIVNLPCHIRLTSKDISYIERILENYIFDKAEAR